MSTCKQWTERDTEQGRVFQYCKGAEKTVACSAMLCRCEFPDFFNVPNHRLGIVRANLKNTLSDMRAQAVYDCGVKI